MENLIELMREVEDRHIKLLKGELGAPASGIHLISKIIKKVFEGKDEETEDVLKAGPFGTSEKILDVFEGKWLGFLLWNKEVTDFAIIWNDFRPKDTDSEEEKNISRNRYDYMSDLISSTEFNRRGFREIMSDWFFLGKYSSQPIVFEWQRRQSEQSKQTQESTMSDKEKYPKKVEFNEFNNVENFISKIGNIVAELKTNLKESKKVNYDIVLEKVAQVADEVINHHQGKRLLKAAIDNIRDFLDNDNNDDDLILHLCRALILNRLFDDEWQFLYFIPALLVDRAPLGGVVFAGTRLLEDHEFLIIGQIINRILGSFHFVLHQDEIKKHQTRSAAIAILSRNMSHNIGSHVIPRAGTKNIWDRVKDLYKDNTPVGTLLLTIVGSLKDRLDDYIRQKSDFLAEITTEPASSSSTAYLYRDIILPFVCNTILIDCLTANEGLRYKEIDDCALRLRLLTSDEQEIHTKNTTEIQAILDRRAEKEISEQDKEPSKLQAIEDSANGKSIGKGFIAPYLMRIPPKFAENIPLYIEGEDRDVMISLPGALGQFAVYGILENLIRNAAKHNRKAFQGKNRDNLEITLWLKDEGDPRYYSLLIYDSVTSPENKTSDEKKLCDFIQDTLDEDLIVAETGQVRRSSWGMAEMVICGNLLIGSTSFTNVGNTEGKQGNRVVCAYADIPPGASEKRLIYEFKLLKTCQALVIGEKLANALLANGSEQEWRHTGIVVKRSWKDFQQFFTDSREMLASFQFVVIEQGVIPPDDKNFCKGGNQRQRLPFRVIRVDPNVPYDKIDRATGDMIVHELLQDGEIWSPKEIDRFLCHLWAIWCRYWLDLAKDSKPAPGETGLVSIYLDDIGDTMLARKWKEKEEQFNASQNPILLQVAWKSSSAPSKQHQGGPVVFLDRHGGATREKTIGQNDSYLAFDKANGDFIHIFQPRFPRSENTPWSFPYELFEAGMLRVLVLDERLAERAMNPIEATDETLSKTRQMLVGEQDSAICMWHVAYGARVLIATHLLVPNIEDPLDTSDMDELDPDKLADKFGASALHSASFRKNFLHYYKALGSNKPSSCPMLIVDLRKGFNLRVHRKGPPIGSDRDSEEKLSKSHVDMIVVHQGILDTYQKVFNQKAFDLLVYLRDLCPWVIVESGRGMPPKVQENYEKFLPFSALDRCFGEKRIAKFMLCKRLMERIRAK